jgi:hypothetical protein
MEVYNTGESSLRHMLKLLEGGRKERRKGSKDERFSIVATKAE